MGGICAKDKPPSNGLFWSMGLPTFSHGNVYFYPKRVQILGTHDYILHSFIVWYTHVNPFLHLYLSITCECKLFFQQKNMLTRSLRIQHAIKLCEWIKIWQETMHTQSKSKRWSLMGDHAW